MRGLWIEHAIVCALLGLVVYSQVCILNGEKRVSDMQIETSKVMRALVLGEVDTLHAVRRAAGAEKLTKAWAPFPPPQHPQAVDCNDVPIATPIRAFGMASLGPKYMVSYSWWDLRGSPHQKTYEQMRTGGANDSVELVQKLILASPPGAAFLDVGANVGFMTFFAPATGRPVYAFDPISYDVSKLCEGVLVNLAARTLDVPQSALVSIFHAAVGPAPRKGIEITRPADRVGFFDQASLSPRAVLVAQDQKTTERVDMLTLDHVVPEDAPVGVVKIDVQGHEEGVLVGMAGILARRAGYPTAVVFEEDHDLTTRAGWTPGNCRRILTTAGYLCKRAGGDTVCTKAAPTG